MSRRFEVRLQQLLVFSTLLWSLFSVLPVFGKDMAVEASDTNAAIDLGTRRELFVDWFLIEKIDGLRLQLHEPHDEGRVLSFDLPHEGPHAAYTTILHDVDRFRMYYRGVSKLGLDGSEDERTCYAESKDGIHWTKPTLGLFEFNGSKENNLVLDRAAPVTHNFCPMIDTRPGVPANERYKGVGGTGKELFAFVSADGLRWTRMQQDPILESKSIKLPHVHLFDSQNLTLWSESEQLYLCYFRVWDGIRRIARATSRDFRTWSQPVLMKQVHRDGPQSSQPAPEEHLYTNQTSAYFRAPHLLIATPARFFEGRQVLSEVQAKAINVNPDYFKDTSDSVFMTSRGGDIYDRVFLEGHIKPGIGARNWVSRTNYPALNIVQTGPTEMSMYVNHDYAQPTAHLRRYSLRLDGFASLRAGARVGTLRSRIVKFQGDKMTLNFATSAAGGIRIELQQPNGLPWPGFALEDCDEQIGNEIEKVVTWKGSSSLTSLKNKPLRIHAVLRDADLYAVQFPQNEGTK